MAGWMDVEKVGWTAARMAYLLVDLKADSSAVPMVVQKDVPQADSRDAWMVAKMAVRMVARLVAWMAD